MTQGCPTDDHLMLFVEGRLDEPVAAEVEEHMDRCVPCRKAVVALLKTARPAPTAITVRQAVEPDDAVIDEEELAPGTLFAGRFRLERPLGQGGIGERLLLATHTVLRRPCALKLIRRALGAGHEVTARFEREAAAAAQLDHPRIAAVHDCGRSEDGQLYIAMEYVRGETLARALEREGAFAIPRALAILDQVLEGLAVAHGRGIVHRDVKPDNIMLTRPGSDDAELEGAESVKILDFGLAKFVEASSDLTTPGVVFGTLLYMSPEQSTGSPVDHRTDIYSFGAVANELVAGGRPSSATCFADTSAACPGRPPWPPAERTCRRRWTGWCCGV